MILFNGNPEVMNVPDLGVDAGGYLLVWEEQGLGAASATRTPRRTWLKLKRESRWQGGGVTVVGPNLAYQRIKTYLQKIVSEQGERACMQDLTTIGCKLMKVEPATRQNLDLALATLSSRPKA